MKRKNVWKIIFVAYVLLLLIFVVVKPIGFLDRMQSILENRSNGIWNYNVDPFRNISSYFRNRTASYAFINILGNLIPFCPLGFLVPIISTKYKKFLKTMLICLISIIGIESFQLVTMLGYFDVDDIILNMTGCLIGYCVYVGFRILARNHSQIRTQQDDEKSQEL